MAKEKTRKSPKRITPYNKFMKTELAKIKKENPNIAHKDAFKMAAENWKHSMENPRYKETAAAK